MPDSAQVRVVGPYEPETEELVAVPVLPLSRQQRNVRPESCEHSASVFVHQAVVDQEAGLLSARLQANIELVPSDCYCIQDVRLRLLLRFRYHGHQQAERVVPFVDSYHQEHTYRETEQGIGQVVSVETSDWALAPQELTVFQHEEHLVADGQLQRWYLPYERLCLDLAWPPRLPAHRPETARFVFSPILIYRLGKQPTCSYDHVQGLGTFYAKPPRRSRVYLA